MLAIRLQRTGRKGHASFRVIVQEARLSPKSGKIAAHLGSYDPHTKTAVLAKEKAEFYLSHGAQPSDRAARILKTEGIKLPEWVELEPNKKRAIKNPEKLRKNRPAGAAAPEKPALPAQTSEEVSAGKEAKTEEETPAEGESNEVKDEAEKSAEEAKEEPKTEEKPTEKSKTAETEKEEPKQ